MNVPPGEDEFMPDYRLRQLAKKSIAIATYRGGFNVLILAANFFQQMTVALLLIQFIESPVDEKREATFRMMIVMSQCLQLVSHFGMLANAMPILKRDDIPATLIEQITLIDQSIVLLHTGLIVALFAAEWNRWIAVIPLVLIHLRQLDLTRHWLSGKTIFPWITKRALYTDFMTSGLR
jgi:hypothetical protein